MPPINSLSDGHTLDIHHVAHPEASNARPDIRPPSNAALVRALTNHVDRALSISQNAFLTRLSAQNALIARQQDTLDSISRTLSAVLGEVTESHETIRADVYDNRTQIEKLDKGISSSIKRLTSETLNAFHESQVKNSERWSAIEESLESLREEIRDSHAECDSHLCRNIITGDGSVALTPSRCPSASTSRVESFEPRNEDYDLVYPDPERDNEGVVSPDNGQSSLETNIATDDCRAQPGHPLVASPYPSGTMDPLDSLHKSTHNVTPALSLNLPSRRGLDDHEGAEDEICSEHSRTLDSVRRITDPQNVAGRGTGDVSQTPGASVSLPLSGRLHEPHKPNLNLGLGAPASKPKSGSSSAASTLPDPRSLLLSYIPKSQKKQSEVPATLPILDAKPATAECLTKPRVASLLSLSTLTSVPPSPSVDGASSPMFRSAGKLPCGSAPTISKKRRRSSPGPVRSKKSKKSGTGITKGVKRVAMGSVGSSKKRRIKLKCPWPQKVSKTTESRQFIQCDKCDLWYHWGCVGIRTDDLRLEDGQEFVCPPCETHLVEDAPKHNRDGKMEACSRPNCDIEGDLDQAFVIERIVGRFDHRIPGIKSFSWLIKWEGYPAEQCDWIPESEIGEAAKLINDFETAVMREGLVNQGQALVLLEEAVDAGWETRIS